MHDLFSNDSLVSPSLSLLSCGVDEAGRGPLAGPVFAAAVILDPAKPIQGLADSKKLSAKKRDYLYAEIIANALAYSITSASIEEIDCLNILQATLKAMQQAVLDLKVLPDIVLIDGTHAPKLPYKTQTIIQGDAKVQEISAASILAKVARDRLMLEMDKLYPEYGFAKHQGYGTKQHLLAIEKHGATPIHRMSFAPMKFF